MNKLNGKMSASATLRGAMTRGAGGGTYVEANPEGEAIGTLEKLMVESDIFKIRNVPDASSAQNGNVLTKTENGVTWASLPPQPETGIKYSTNEQEVGTWLDGSKIYQKSILLSSPVIVTSGDWFPISEVSIVGANKNIKTELYLGDDDSQTTVFGKFINGVLNVYTTISLKVSMITIQYTKVGE